MMLTPDYYKSFILTRQALEEFHIKLLEYSRNNLEEGEVYRMILGNFSILERDFLEVEELLFSPQQEVIEPSISAESLADSAQDLIKRIAHFRHTKDDAEYIYSATAGIVGTWKGLIPPTRSTRPRM